MEIGSAFPEEFQTLFEKLPEFVDRKTLSRESGGIISPGTLANCDCQGTGPSKRIVTQKRVLYPRGAAVQWLASRCRIVNATGE